MHGKEEDELARARADLRQDIALFVGVVFVYIVYLYG